MNLLMKYENIISFVHVASVLMVSQLSIFSFNQFEGGYLILSSCLLSLIPYIELSRKKIIWNALFLFGIPIIAYIVISVFTGGLGLIVFGAYLLFFFKSLLLGAGIAFIITRPIRYVLTKNAWNLPKYMSVVLFCVFACISVIPFLSINQAAENDRAASSNSAGFIIKIGNALNDNKLNIFTSEEVIRQRLYEDYYKVENGEIKNEYGGSVELYNEGSQYSILYTGIPSGKTCNQFSVPGLIKNGFELAKVNNQSAVDLRLGEIYELCSSSSEPVSVEFSGNIVKIKKESAWSKSYHESLPR